MVLFEAQLALTKCGRAHRSHPEGGDLRRGNAAGQGLRDIILLGKTLWALLRIRRGGLCFWWSQGRGDLVLSAERSVYAASLPVHKGHPSVCSIVIAFLQIASELLVRRTHFQSDLDTYFSLRSWAVSGLPGSLGLLLSSCSGPSACGEPCEKTREFMPVVSPGPPHVITSCVMVLLLRM